MKIRDQFFQQGDIFTFTGAVAHGHRERLIGLSHRDLSDSPAEMIFQNCRSIHTFGMRFPLRVIFLDSDSKIISSRIVTPRRIVFGPRGTRTIVEQPVR